MPAKKKRRARGTGSIFQAKGKWVGRIEVGRKSDGRIHYAERTACTQSALIAKLANIAKPGPDTTVNQWIPRWLELLDVRKGTRDLSEHYAKEFFTPALGAKRIAQVTAHDIERAVKSWSAKLAPTTQKTVLGYLSGFFSSAIRAGIITTNPVRAAKKPKSAAAKIHPFSTEELAEIVTAASSRPAARPIALLAVVGMRIGECVALNVDDFNLTSHMLSITKTQSTKHGVGPPKSENGVREIRIPSQVLPVLRAAIGSRKTGAMFLTLNNARQTQTGIRSAWTHLLRGLVFSYRRVHQLRHSVATALISAGDPLGDVAQFLGDSVGTIVDTYLHPSGKDPSTTMEKLLGGVKVDTVTKRA